MSISYITTTNNHSTVYRYCKGYNIVGISQRACQVNGSWNEQPAQCQNCGDLRIVSGYYGNLTVNFPSTTPNSTAMSICIDSRYRLVRESTRVCNANGSWSSNQPKCCAVPQNVLGNATSASSIQLSWTLPLQPNNITDYIKYYIIEIKDLKSGQIITNRSTEQLVVIDSLQSYYTYLCRVASYLDPHSDYI